MRNSRRVLSAREKMRRYRVRQRAKGLRPVQLWVPDTRSPKFAAEARRQSRLVSKHPGETEILDWIESVANPGDWR